MFERFPNSDEVRVLFKYFIVEIVILIVFL